MTYRATRTLSTKRGLIRMGEKVPSNHPQFNKLKERGWIIDDKIDEKAAPSIEEPVEVVVEPELTEVEKVEFDSVPIEPEPVPETEKVKFDSIPVVGDHYPNIGDEPEQFKPESKLIGALHYINRRDESALAEKGIVEVADLKDWTLDTLMEIRRIGETKAKQLMHEYDKFIDE